MRLAALMGTLPLALLLQATAATAEPLVCFQGPATPELVEAFRFSAATALNDQTLTATEVAQQVQACLGTQVPACMKRVVDYATRDDLAPASQDLTAAQSPQKRPPDEFLREGATGLEYVVPENIEALAAERGWPVVRYKSRHSGGFDSETPSLLMIYVAGDRVTPPVAFDRWLNIALPADEGDAALTPSPQAPMPSALDYAGELTGGLDMPRTFTMVALDRRQEFVPGQVYFQMFYRGQSGSPVFVPRSPSSTSSCVSCHPNGLRAISPLGYHVREGEPQLPEASWRAVEIINDAMITAAGGKTVSWRDALVDVTTGVRKPLLNPKSQGPIVGPSRPLNGGSRTKEFILGSTLADGTVVAGCFNERSTIYVTDIFGRAPGRNNIYTLSAQPVIDWEKVSDAMSCSGCHNDNTRGALNRRTDWDQIDFKILVDQSMPLGLHSNPLEQGSATAPVVDELTADERIALTNCLKAEYALEQRQLFKWLTQGVCQ